MRFSFSSISIDALQIHTTNNLCFTCSEKEPTGFPLRGVVGECSPDRGRLPSFLLFGCHGDETPSAHAHDMRRCEITETLTERQRKSARLIFGSFFIDEDEARKVSRRSDLILDSLFCIVDERNVANIG